MIPSVTTISVRVTVEVTRPDSTKKIIRRELTAEEFAEIFSDRTTPHKTWSGFLKMVDRWQWPKHGLERHFESEGDKDIMVCNCGEMLGECPLCGVPIYCKQVKRRGDKQICPECGGDMNR